MGPRQGLRRLVPAGPVDRDRIASRVDGQTKQDSSTAQMVFSVAEIIAYASAAFTLLPGDVILTGTPAGVGQVDEGDRIEVEVEGIGTLATVLRR